MYCPRSNWPYFKELYLRDERPPSKGAQDSPDTVPHASTALLSFPENSITRVASLVPMFILCSTPEVRVVVFPFLECIIAGSPFDTCTPPPGSGGGMVAGTGTRSDLFGVSKDAENCLFSYHRKYHFIWDTLLVFLTQKLSTRKSLRTPQALTATHDSTAAWGGIGSSLSYLWHQKTVSVSMFGVLSVVTYLGSILVLHVTTSSLISLQTFNLSRLLPFTTQSVPVFNFAAENWTTNDFGFNRKGWFNVHAYTRDSLSSLPSILGGKTNTVGLYDGTLYDTLGPNEGVGNVTVKATGFNISCGYIADINPRYHAKDYCWKFVIHGATYCIPDTLPGIITSRSSWGAGENLTLIFYSTGIPIVDSDNDCGHWVDVKPAMNTSVSSIQLLRCSLSLVDQTAIINSQTQHWEFWYNTDPETDIYFSKYTGAFFHYADLYVIQELNLLPENTDPPTGVALYELENTISRVVASLFWAHIYPMVGRSAKDRNIDMYLIYICLPTVKTKAASVIEPKVFR
ncbi:hypothetical protein B0H14DRAFT_2649647 [Mycena olivaceomarginata]|nr:hypothetical protein B0H14DRAFT_2649647 [Mycena olivaceomarginata]